MMKSLQKLWQSVSLLLVCLSLVIFGFATSAIASIQVADAPCIFGKEFILCEAQITGGEFTVKAPASVPGPITVRSAVLSLPDDETGKITKIVITGPDNQREFGCENINVKNGTNLIKECGGPAVLKPGDTLYIAAGNNFKPDPDLSFGVTLRSEF